MTFVGDKTKDKETIHHYFSSQINNYILKKLTNDIPNKIRDARYISG